MSVNKLTLAIWTAADKTLPIFDENGWTYHTDTKVSHGDIRAMLWELVEALRHNPEAKGISSGRFYVEILDHEAGEYLFYFLGDLHPQDPDSIDKATVVAAATDEAVEIEMWRRKQKAADLKERGPSGDIIFDTLREFYIKQFGDDEDEL